MQIKKHLKVFDTNQKEIKPDMGRVNIRRRWPAVAAIHPSLHKIVI